MRNLICIAALVCFCTIGSTAQVKHPAKKTTPKTVTSSAEGGNLKLYHSYSREIDLEAAPNKILNVSGSTLFDALMKGIKEQKIKVYAELANPKTVTDEPFTKPLTNKQFLDAISDVVMVDRFDTEGNQIGTKKMVMPFSQDNLVGYRIKEVVYLNKQTGKVETQIIGIAPLRIIRLTNGDVLGSAPICWLKFKQCQPFMAQTKVSGNPKLTAPVNLGDFFTNRAFASKITEESNAKGLRIMDYMQSPKDQDKEAARIEAVLADYKANPLKY